MAAEEDSAAPVEWIWSAIQKNPYEPGNYLTRADQYERLGYPELAAGDAYKALLLSDEIQDDCGEYHENVIEAIEVAMQEINSPSGERTRMLCQGTAFIPRQNDRDWGSEEIDGEMSRDHLYLAERVAHESFRILSRTLMECGCLKSAYDFASRGLQAFPGDKQFLKIQTQIVKTRRAPQGQQDQHAAHHLKTTSTIELQDRGLVRRELYAWNRHEPDRFAVEKLAELSSRLKEVAPKLEVRAMRLPLLHNKASQADRESSEILDEPYVQAYITQLGLFATEDIAPHETVLHERSMLAANNRLYDVLCDACSAPLPPISPNAPPLPSCPDCEDTIFCSTTCQSLALDLYHPAVCNKLDFDILAKDPSPEASATALYLALLGRVLAMSVTKDVHPLDLPDIKYLWGDFTSPELNLLAAPVARKLPFTFHDNILAPLHMLEKMDIDPFANPHLCDTWVINTLYAKFRGTASARFSTDPRSRVKGPEVCAVHPMWCLANHSCAPNVKWEWGGEIRFEARGGEDVVRWGEGTGEGEREGKGKGEEERWKGGIRKGEEVLNHYCDVDLPVKERREWMVGTLGGMCMCQRCVWEEEQLEKSKEKF